MTKYALGILVVLVLAQAGVWGAVSVSWTDSVGYHNESLQCLWNPEYDGMPWSLEKKYAWQGAISVVMDTMGPIQFTVSGNFWGGGTGLDHDIWYQVRIEQTVLNMTGRAWNGFWLDTQNLTPDPNPTRNPTFYTVYQWIPYDWDAYIWPGGMHETYDAMDPDLGPFVYHGESFFDVVKVYSDVDFGTGDGGFYLYKIAVPEPGSMAAVVGCMAGLVVYMRRRKA